MAIVNNPSPGQQTNSNGTKSATGPQAQQSIDEEGYGRLVNWLTLYLMAVLFFSFWFLLDIWSGNFTSMKLMGISGKALEDPLLATIGFTMGGGLFGGILYHMRMLYRYHTSGAFSLRWTGKYLSAPWESAAMALVVLSLIRGGVTLFGGSTGTDVTAVNNFAAFGTGALVGLGMRDVVGWVGKIVRSVFASDESEASLGSGNKKPPTQPPTHLLQEVKHHSQMDVKPLEIVGKNIE